MHTAQFEMTPVSLVVDLAAKFGLQISAVFSKIALQARIRQERKQLLEMPAHRLADLGISPGQAIAEASSWGLPKGRV